MSSRLKIANEDRVILSNKIKCKKCNDIIESRDVHEFKYCSCKAVAVDGGRAYLRRIGNAEDFEDLSEIVSKNKYIKMLEERVDYLTKVNKQQMKEINHLIDEREIFNKKD